MTRPDPRRFEKESINKRKEMLLVISGPSGAGKSTLCRQVLNNLEGIEFSVSHTTRNKRKGEIEGKDYYFVSQEEFKSMIKENELAEWAVVHGHYYGTSKREIEKKGAKGDLLLDIDIQGAKQVKEKFKKAVFIFIMPPHFQDLKRRLKTRGQENLASVQRRLEVARKEIRYYHQFDYVVINDELKKAVQELESIIRSTRCNLDSRKMEILSILRSFTGS
jgi:guanylate kinase